MTFRVDTAMMAGRYDVSLELRTTGDYPYTQLYATVEQTTGAGSQPVTFQKTFSITDEKGQRTGNAVLTYTTSVPVTTLTLQPGDSIIYKVYHQMRTFALPGVADVGIKIKRQ